MISLIFFSIYLAVVVFCLVKIVALYFDYFEKRGIKYRRPFPFIGTNIWLLQNQTLAHHLQESYNIFSKEKVFGLFNYRKPILIVRDPAIVKRFTVKDFDYFSDHARVNDSKLVNSTLFFMRGQKWREMRAGMSPAFTGSKLRLMFELITNAGQQMVDTLDDDYKEHGIRSYDLRDLFSKITNDVIATCAFGLQCDSLKDPENYFYKIARTFLNVRKPRSTFQYLVDQFFPKITKFFRSDDFLSKATHFFNEVIIETMKTRERENIVRPDMINLLMQLRKGELKAHDDEEAEQNRGVTSKKEWSDIELIAQCFIFFIAGLETVSTLMLFAAYELALNPEVQEKLREEIDEVKANLDREPVTFEAIQGMKYMDQVLSEALRKWPPVLNPDRTCVKPYKYEDEDGLKFEMKKGDTLWIPVHALQRDPNYFLDPDKFDPERFSDENKNQIIPGTYLPFGMGPRLCIGSRLALLEVKTIMFYLLSSYSLEVCDKTPIPMKLGARINSLQPEKEVFLNFKPINK